MGSKVSKFDPKSLKLYQLFIGLGSHEFRFQSLENPKDKFFVNVDTVRTEHLPVNSPARGEDTKYQHRIHIIVDGIHDLDFYFTDATLPFGM